VHRATAPGIVGLKAELALALVNPVAIYIQLNVGFVSLTLSRLFAAFG
jgi:hypothetical protein